MKTIRTMLLLAMAGLALAACGGAVEGGDTTVDTTAPNFVIGDPPEGTVNNAVLRVTAEFDDPLDAATVTHLSFIIKNDSATEPLTADSGTWGLSASSETIAQFVPTTVKLVGTYTVTVTTDIKNKAGLPLAVDQSWSFTATVPDPP
jgi:hypothetical protein